MKGLIGAGIFEMEPYDTGIECKLVIWQARYNLIPIPFLLPIEEPNV